MGQDEKTPKKEKREDSLVVILTVLLIVILVLQLLYISVVNSLIDPTRNYQSYIDELYIMRKENLLLTDELLKNESLMNISDEAKKRGFIEVKKYIYLQP